MGGLDRLKETSRFMFDASWVLSWSSRYQLDSMAVLAMRLQVMYPYQLKGLFAADFDEADEVIRTLDEDSQKMMEKQIDALFQFKRVSLLLRL